MAGIEPVKHHLRILVVTGYYKPAYQFGGPVRSISSMCEGLSRIGQQVTVYTTNANGHTRLEVELASPKQVDGVEVWYFPLTLGGLGFFYSGRLSQTIKRNLKNFDIVIAEMLWMHAGETIRVACKKAEIPYLVPLRGQMQPWALARRILKKKVYLSIRGRRFVETASGLMATSQEEAQNVDQLGFKTPVFVVPNSIDTSYFDHLQDGSYLGRKLNIPGDAIVLLFTGRLETIKKPDIAIEVCAKMQGKFPQPVHVILAGPGSPERISELQDLANQLGVSAQVHLTGLLDFGNLCSALALSDLLLMPSNVSENFGMSALEALAAGVPILVSTGVPVGRWAAQAGAGRVVECTVEAFSQAAAEMLADPQELAEMGRRGRELARQKFDSQVVARQMLAQFQAIIATGRPLPEENNIL